VRVLFDGEVWVHYGQVYVESDPDRANPLLEEAFAGQANGLCGAAAPGALFLVTGLHTGHVGLAVELHDGPPPVDDAWEEIVEASFAPVSSRIALVEWAGAASWSLELERAGHRVRYCASGMEAGRARDTLLEGEPLLDRYLLQLWPGPPGPDRVMKQTSEIAAYWHRFVGGLPPPPTPAERAEAERRAAEDR
jgi:hypothetical protein